MKKRTIVYALAGFSCYLIICGHSGGPAAVSGYDCTGAETGLGNPTGCYANNGCHSSVSTAGIALSLELDSLGVPTTHYTGGKNYTVKITGTNNTNSTLPKFGFQMGSIKGSVTMTTPAMAGTWPSPYPTNVHYTSPTSGFVVGVVEHGARLLPTSGSGGNGTVYSETVNWTAPVTGTGAVSIWSALNAVNANNLADAGDLWNVNHVMISEWAPMGVASLEHADFNVNVFPNPSNGKFVVDSPIIKGEISVYNLQGECIHQQICKSTNQQIDLSSQPCGIYFLQLKTEQGTATQKLIIRK